MLRQVNDERVVLITTANPPESNDSGDLLFLIIEGDTDGRTAAYKLA